MLSHTGIIYSRKIMRFPHTCVSVQVNMMFDPYGDLKNGGTTYYYWTDGSMRDQAENAGKFAYRISCKTGLYL